MLIISFNLDGQNNSLFIDCRTLARNVRRSTGILLSINKQLQLNLDDESEILSLSLSQISFVEKIRETETETAKAIKPSRQPLH